MKYKKDLQANKKRQIKNKKKIYRAKYRNELDDDLEEHVEKKFKPVVTFFITSHQLGAQSVSSPFPRSQEKNPETVIHSAL